MPPRWNEGSQQFKPRKRSCATKTGPAATAHPGKPPTTRQCHVRQGIYRPLCQMSKAILARARSRPLSPPMHRPDPPAPWVIQATGAVAIKAATRIDCIRRAWPHHLQPWPPFAFAQPGRQRAEHDEPHAFASIANVAACRYHQRLSASRPERHPRTRDHDREPKAAGAGVARGV